MLKYKIKVWLSRIAKNIKEISFLEQQLINSALSAIK